MALPPRALPLSYIGLLTTPADLNEGCINRNVFGVCGPEKHGPAAFVLADVVAKVLQHLLGYRGGGFVKAFHTLPWNISVTLPPLVARLCSLILGLPLGFEPRLHPYQGCVLAAERQEQYGAAGGTRTLGDRLRSPRECSTN